jgi:hypothetical protein
MAGKVINPFEYGEAPNGKREDAPDLDSTA